jgi:hypothetical protein
MTPQLQQSDRRLLSNLEIETFIGDALESNFTAGMESALKVQEAPPKRNPRDAHLQQNRALI